ncbi:lysis system i-spanin subunit Rz [Xenorhabdus innexi]|uniref:Lysis protein n=1 Tax=Xenorhabdus innexi TaxID=290109 RepID=A0A1N6MRY7_9GAMM|nr:lysis system i-spanin subunit Rz [Xenorhabdus innexi]PHM38581.1 lysis protein [Xenorhabdus innexi]SIP71591.1 putative Phosphoprotein phosphatase [Xenorhabdus innexi]
MSGKWQLFSLVGIALIGFMGNSLINKNTALRNENQSLNQSLSAQVAINLRQQESLNALHEQDTQRLQELTHAKAEIDRLHAASVAHPERVYIKAECSLPETPAAPGVVNATDARPTDAAVRDYWLLRERIATAAQMMQGLQEYIQTQCR